LSQPVKEYFYKDGVDKGRVADIETAQLMANWEEKMRKSSRRLLGLLDPSKEKLVGINNRVSRGAEKGNSEAKLPGTENLERKEAKMRQQVMRELRAEIIAKEVGKVRFDLYYRSLDKVDFTLAGRLITLSFKRRDGQMDVDLKCEGIGDEEVLYEIAGELRPFIDLKLMPQHE